MATNKAGGGRARPESRAGRVTKKKKGNGKREDSVGTHVERELRADGGSHTVDKLALVAERRELVAGLVDSGASTAQIVQAFHSRFDYMTPASAKVTATKYIREARKVRLTEYREAKGSTKAEQVARLRNDLLRMRAMPRQPWSSIAKHEELLARILGTFEPIGVNVSGSVAVHESIIACVSRLDPRDVEELVAEQVAVEAAATQAGLDVSKVLPQNGPPRAMDDRSSMDPIDVEGFEVPGDPEAN